MLQTYLTNFELLWTDFLPINVSTQINCFFADNENIFSSIKSRSKNFLSINEVAGVTIFLKMASFGVAPVFINIPLLETFDICANILFQVQTCIAALIKEQFHE